MFVCERERGGKLIITTINPVLELIFIKAFSCSINYKTLLKRNVYLIMYLERLEETISVFLKIESTLLISLLLK